jgi:hypothetical protein
LLFREPNIEPTNQLISEGLKGAFNAYTKLRESLISDLKLSYQWNYYKDGKAWLCKVSHKKKTVFWLSTGDQSFTITFYFTQKNQSDIFALPIDISIKENFANAKHLGKLMPLTIEIHNDKPFSDILKIVNYKLSLL